MKISLRKYKLSDLNNHLELLKNNKVKATKEKESKWIKEVINNYNRKEPKFYSLVILLNKKAIGNVIAEKIDLKKKRADIGFWIGKKYWSKGYTTKAVKLFINHLKRKFGIKEAYANCNKRNVASARVLNKLGFKVVSKKSNNIYFEKRMK